MGLHCACPQGHLFNVKPEFAGKRATCPECGAVFLIPNESLSVKSLSTDKEAAENVTAPSLQTASTVPTTPEAIEWRLANPEGEQFGPTVPTVFAQWIVQGRVPDDWLVWRTGWSDWRRAGEAESELPAPLPQANFADTPPPLTAPPRTQKTTGAKAGSAKTTEINPTSDYNQRRKRTARRQQFIIILLGVLTLLLVGVLAYVATK